MAFRPGPDNELPGLRTVRLTTTADPGPHPQAVEIRLADAGPELVAALGAPGVWTRTGPVATSFARSDGRLHVDLVFVETPHRLHVRLDPATGQFLARWQTAPFEDPPLAELRMPR
jgi:hypothetical protein